MLTVHQPSLAPATASAGFHQVQTLKKSGKKKAHTFQGRPGRCTAGQLGVAPWQRDLFSFRNSRPRACIRGCGGLLGHYFCLQFYQTQLLWEAHQHLKKEPALQVDVRSRLMCVRSCVCACVFVFVFKGLCPRSTAFLRELLVFYVNVYFLWPRVSLLRE